MNLSRSTSLPLLLLIMQLPACVEPPTEPDRPADGQKDDSLSPTMWGRYRATLNVTCALLGGYGGSAWFTGSIQPVVDEIWAAPNPHANASPVDGCGQPAMLLRKDGLGWAITGGSGMIDYTDGATFLPSTGHLGVYFDTGTLFASDDSVVLRDVRLSSATDDRIAVREISFDLGCCFDVGSPGASFDCSSGTANAQLVTEDGTRYLSACWSQNKFEAR